VTSPTGAVIRDMLHGFEERFPSHVIVWPVRVQGETSAAEVAAAIRGFNALETGGRIARPDVLIVARGGGSLEDLWGFNEEIVVRAASESEIPLISAVGHETDWTLIDLVADARAPTPTKAAEWAVPKYSELRDQTDQFGLRARTAARRFLEGVRGALLAAARGLPRAEELVAMPRQRFDAADQRFGRSLLANTRSHGLRLARVASQLRPGLLAARLQSARDRLALAGRRAGSGLNALAGIRRTRLERAAGRLSPQTMHYRLTRARQWFDALGQRGDRAFSNRITAFRSNLGGSAKLLQSLGYHSILSRGFALVRGPDGRAVRSKDAVSGGMRLRIEFSDGSVGARADDAAGIAGTGSGPEQQAATTNTDKTTTGAKRPPTSKPPGGQGSLF